MNTTATTKAVTIISSSDIEKATGSTLEGLCRVVWTQFTNGAVTIMAKGLDPVEQSRQIHFAFESRYGKSYDFQGIENMLKGRNFNLLKTIMVEAFKANEAKITLKVLAQANETKTKASILAAMSVQPKSVVEEIQL